MTFAASVANLMALLLLAPVVPRSLKTRLPASLSLWMEEGRNEGG